MPSTIVEISTPITQVNVSGASTVVEISNPITQVTVAEDNTTVEITETYTEVHIPSEDITVVTVAEDITEVYVSDSDGNALKIQGVPVSATAPTDEQALVYNSASEQWEPTDQSGGTDSPLNWEGNEVTGATQMAVGQGYTANNISQVPFTLPATAAQGKQVGVCGKGAGGWKVQGNAGQYIHLGALTTISGGSVTPDHYAFSAIFLCITANTDWSIIFPTGLLNLETS